MEAKFNLDISYTQIAIFDRKMKNPFNDWEQKHVDQGFSWRKKSISFQTLDNDNTSVKVEFVEKYKKLEVGCKRAISVPFHFTGKEIEIASISDSQILQIPTGKYQVIFQIGSKNKKSWIKFTFIQNGDLEPKIILKDKKLKVVKSLYMKSNAAS